MAVEMTSEDKHLWENPNEEHHIVNLIKKYLLTPDQREALHKADLSIEDMMNGRFSATEAHLVLGIFADWNGKLGEKYFHFF